MQLVKGSALSGSLSSLLLTCCGLFACLDFGPCLFVSFLSLAWVLFFKTVWQGFIQGMLGEIRSKDRVTLQITLIKGTNVGEIRSKEMVTLQITLIKGTKVG
jgi:hypothetical protein